VDAHPGEPPMEGEIQKLIHMEERLHQRVIGQDEAIVAVSNAIRRARAGLQDPNRPRSCSTTNRRWCASTCRSIRKSTPSRA
jgi:ATP-dependent Clp protease ATP-binding subunit ClpA